MDASHNESPEEASSYYKGTRQPPVHERLQQIKNFLSDEDYWRYPNFTDRLKDIEEYVEFLEAGNQRYKEDMLRDIKSMIEVHQTWIKEEIEPTPLDLNIPNILFRTRLGRERTRPGLVQDELEGAKNLKDKEWLKIEAPLFEVADPKDRPAIDTDPFHFTSVIMDVQNMQAQISGWVASQLSQQFAPDVQYIPYSIKAPGPVTLLSAESIREKRVQRLWQLGNLYLALTEADKIAPRPLLTTVLLNIMDGMSKVRNPLLSTDPPIINDFDEKVLALPFTQSNHRLLQVLTEKSWNRQEKVLYDVEPPRFSEENRNRLRAFAVDVYQSFTSTLWPEADSWVSVEGLKTYINSYSKSPFAPYDLDVVKFNLEIMAKGNIIRYDGNDIVRKPVIDGHPESRFFWPELPIHESVQYNGSKKWGPPRLLDPKVFPVVAARLGRTMRMLKEDLDIDQETWIEREKAALAAYEDTIKNNPPGSPNIDQRIREAVDAANVQNLPVNTEEDARHFIQDRALEELNWNFQPRKPDYSRIWAFARDKPEPAEPYFALDRWPLCHQMKERQAQIRASGPRKEEDDEGDDEEEEGPEFPFLTAEEQLQQEQHERERKDPRVRYVPGETVYPFGETPFQQVVLADRMDWELEDIKELASANKLTGREAVAHKKVDPFALPPLPTGWSMADPTGAGAGTTSASTRAQQQQPWQAADAARPRESPYVEDLYGDDDEDVGMTQVIEVPLQDLQIVNTVNVLLSGEGGDEERMDVDPEPEEEQQEKKEEQEPPRRNTRKTRSTRGRGRK